MASIILPSSAIYMAKPMKPLASAAPTDSASWLLSPGEGVGEELRFRRFLCPNCDHVLDSQGFRPGNEPFPDVSRLG
jgi:hypothetical protein